MLSTTTPSATHRLRCHTAVILWTGETGRVTHVTADGWVGVRVDGETEIHEWAADQVAVAS